MNNNIMQYESKIWSTADLLRGVGFKESTFPEFMMPFFALMMVESRLIREADKVRDDFEVWLAEDKKQERYVPELKIATEDKVKDLGESGFSDSKYQIVPSNKVEYFKNCVPLIPLKAAAGKFIEKQRSISFRLRSI